MLKNVEEDIEDNEERLINKTQEMINREAYNERKQATQLIVRLEERVRKNKKGDLYTIQQMETRWKSRLEDLTLSFTHQINQALSVKSLF